MAGFWSSRAREILCINADTLPEEAVKAGKELIAHCDRGEEIEFLTVYRAPYRTIKDLTERIQNRRF